MGSKVAFVGIAGVLALGAAGCSSSSSSSDATITTGPTVDSSMTASDIASTSASAVKTKDVVTINGSLASSDFTGNLSVTVNRSKDYSVAATSGTGSTSNPSVQLIRTGGTTYINIAGSYLSKQIPASSGVTAAITTAMVNALSEKWLIVPTTGTFSKFANVGSIANDLNLQQLADELKKVPKGITVGAQTTANGVSALPLTAQGTTIFISTDGALPVRITQSGSANAFDLDYPSSSNISAPAGAVTVKDALGPALAAAFSTAFSANL